MALTQDNLIAAALGKLGAVAAGQTPSAEDIAAVAPNVTTALDGLFVEGVYGPVDTTDIPSEAYPHLVRIVAEEMAPDFGRKTDTEEVEYRKVMLRRLRRTIVSRQPARPDYF